MAPGGRADQPSGDFCPRSPRGELGPQKGRCVWCKRRPGPSPDGLSPVRCSWCGAESLFFLPWQLVPQTRETRAPPSLRAKGEIVHSFSKALKFAICQFVGPRVLCGLDLE